MTAAQRPLTLESEAPPLHQDVSGVIRVGRTRVTLESVVSLFDQGASPEEIGLRHDVLELHDIQATLSYVLGHRDEVQVYLLTSPSHSNAHRGSFAASTPQQHPA